MWLYNVGIYLSLLALSFSIAAIDAVAVDYAIAANVYSTLDDVISGQDHIHTTERRQKRKAPKITSVDICYLVDITGSMKPYLEGIKKAAPDTIRFLSQRPGSNAITKLRLSFVGYRDFGDNPKIHHIPFTENWDYFLEELKKVQAFGGGDDPEDVFSGLRTAVDQHWTGASRVMLHLADAPCHGTGCGGQTADPGGRNAQDIFRDLKRKKISYSFGRITRTTDAMIKMFSKAYGRNIPVFDISHPDGVKASSQSQVQG